MVLSDRLAVEENVVQVVFVGSGWAVERLLFPDGSCGISAKVLSETIDPSCEIRF